MNQIDRTNLYAQAIQKWGKVNQMDMCVEECAELIQAINKFKRKVSAETIKDLCGEIADVEIMCEQMRGVLQKSGLIDNIKDEKLQRLNQRIIKSEN